MPFKCVVPGCRSNYRHIKGTRSTPMMKFPTDPVTVAAWVQAIHRPGFIPTAHSHVCIKHFRPDQQIWQEYYRQPDGTYRNVKRRHAKLRANAVPSIFDVDPSQWRMRSRHKRQLSLAPKPDTGRCEIITGYKVQFKPEMWEDKPKEKEEATEQPPPVKRPRGRPRKNPLVITEPKIDSSNIDKIDYVSCCALACTNTSESHVMTSLPRDPHLRQSWIEKIDRLFWTPDEESALCEIHFEADMWNNNAGDSKILKLGAVPSLFLHGEAIKSWVTLDNSTDVLEEDQDSNEVVEVSRSESEEEDPDTLVKREVLEPQIDMVEGVEDVLPHDPDSTGEQFETIYCDTTYNDDEDSGDVGPHALHIKEEKINYDESSMEEENVGNPLESDCFGEDRMNDDVSLIQDDQVTCMSTSSGKVKLTGKPKEGSVKPNYYVISHPNGSLKKPIKRRRSCQLTDEFQCPMCFKKLSRQKNLDIHIEKLHKNGELSEYQMMMRKNGTINQSEEDCILRKRLQSKKPPPALTPIGSNWVPSSSFPVESPTSLPIPALKPIIASKTMLSPSSKISTASSDLKETSSSGSPALFVTSAPLIATSSSIPTFLAANSSIPNLLATSSSSTNILAPSSSNPTLLATHSSTPNLLATNSSNSMLATNSNIPTLLASNSTAPTLIATSAMVGNPCLNDPSTSGGRIQNQFLLLLPKHPNSSSTPFDQQMTTADDSKYFIDLSKVPGKQREKLKNKIKEMLHAVLSKNLDPGKIIIAYDRT